MLLDIESVLRFKKTWFCQFHFDIGQFVANFSEKV